MRDVGNSREDGGVSGGGVSLGGGIISSPSCCGVKTGLFARSYAQSKGPQGVDHNMNLR